MLLYIYRMTTPSNTVKVRKVRKSPLESAIVAADRATARATKRKLRTFKRIDTLRAKIASVTATAGTFDTLIAQLQANADNLRKVVASMK